MALQSVRGRLVILYRVVDDRELHQIRETGDFRLVSGAAEGKYFWECCDDAKRFSLHPRIRHAGIVCAKYLASSAETFVRFKPAEARGFARFAEKAKINQGLVEVAEL
jgi:hypothetical protein